MSRVTEQVEIREACREEYEAIGDLIVSAYIGYPEVAEDPDYIEELRDVATRAAVRPVLVAVDETGTVLGSATYISGPGPFAESQDEDEAAFRMLAVRPSARGRGVGEALTRACIDRARADGRARIVLFTLPAMTTAHRLYERLGFERSPERDWEFAPGRRLLSYRLALR
ncbi:MAG: GNAT family N-acetyltransferase [Chloroflexi bacterium]|nr:MAG: GNAT family N-acetyltransferase [Chloroflexota bacterium]